MLSSVIDKGYIETKYEKFPVNIDFLGTLAYGDIFTKHSNYLKQPFPYFSDCDTICYCVFLYIYVRICMLETNIISLLISKMLE